MYQIKYNQWEMNVDTDNMTVEVTNHDTNSDYTHVYDIEGTVKSIEQSEEYVMIHLANGDHYQFKFEYGEMLVSDLFDKDGEHIEELGCWVFGEDELIN